MRKRPKFFVLQINIEFSGGGGTALHKGVQYRYIMGGVVFGPSGPPPYAHVCPPQARNPMDKYD